MVKSLLPESLARGYESFRNGTYAEERERYLQLGIAHQHPRTMVIACCDSRSAPETIFGAGPGDLFVVRNVANLVPPYAPDGKNHSTSAALEFAVLSLNVEHIVVMGHGKCGGIEAASSDDFNPLSAGDFIGKWVSTIRDIVTEVNAPEDVSLSEKRTLIEHASIVRSLYNLRGFPWLAARELDKKITIHGAWFDIALGELHVYDEKEKQWVSA